MGEIILSGGGDADQTAIAHRQFASDLDKSHTLLYIPLAGDPSYRSFEASSDYIHHSLAPYGINKIKMWTDLKNKTMNDIKRFSGVYISGGSSSRLNIILLKSGFAEVLKDYFHQGGKIFGQSAGAIVLGKQFIPTENHETEQSMNLLHPYSVWCHYDSSDDERIKDYSLLYHSPILAIPDGGVIHYSQGTMKDLRQTAFEFKDGEKRRMSDR